MIRFQTIVSLVASPFLMLVLILAESPAVAEIDGCSYDGIELKGDVEVVDNFGDIKVEFVDNFADLNVELVDNFPDDCGEWKIVDNFGDFSIEYVDNFGDIKVKFVDNFPGVP